MNALVSALANGVIMSVVITAVVWLVMTFTSTRVWNAATRYAVWWAVLLVTVALPILYMPIQWLSMDDRIAPIASFRIEARAVETPAHLRTPLDTVSPVGQRVSRSSFPIQLVSGPWVRWTVLAWAAASLFMLARLIVSYVLLERRKQRASSLFAYEERPGEWLRRCGGGKRRVRLALSEEIRTPVAAGPYRPTILIPAHMFDALNEAELDHIGLHEAAHVARRDDYALILERVIEAFFVFHPVVHWVARRIDLEREMACDDIVVRVTGRAAPYASCLTRIAELGSGPARSPLAASVVEPQSHLERRIEMLLDKTRRSQSHVLKLRLSAALIALGLMAWAASEVRGFILLATPPPPVEVKRPEPPPPILSAAAPAPARSVVPRMVRQQAPATSAPFVWLSVIVTDSMQRYVSGLQRQHFKIYEGDTEQNIAQFVESTKDLSVGVVMDVRDSFGGEMARRTADEFLRNFSPSDEFFLLQLDASAALLDRVKLGLTRLASAGNRRKVVLIVSDGNDRSSAAAAEQVVMLASSSDVSIYVISLIQLYQSRISTPGVLSGPALLDAIAERSGGRHFAVADAGDFPDVTNKIGVELRNSYSLGYQPTGAQRDGTFRRVRVEVVPPLGIRSLTAMTRTGYYAAAPQR